MKKSSDSNIKPKDIKKSTCKQNKDSDVVPNLPLRGVTPSPSSGGKSVLLANLILKNGIVAVPKGSIFVSQY